MSDFVLVKPLCQEESKAKRLESVLQRALEGCRYDELTSAQAFDAAQLRGKKILFAVPIGESGINLAYYGILKKIRTQPDCLEGCIGAVIIDGVSEFHTKTVARSLAFSANTAGCAFIGKALVEATGTLKNYNTIAKNLSTDNLEAYAISASQLVRRLLAFEPPVRQNPRVLAIHASHNKTSNTRALWTMVKEKLTEVQIKEISLQEGEIKDCFGCPYTTCRHFGEQGACFYGGVITEQVYPALLDCDTLVVVSPNYNDALGAYITAFINRLTSLFRVNQLLAKQLFAVVVSGYSGGDLLAQQLIGALNMNKPFILPARFALFETANDPGEILRVPDIDKYAAAFANNMLRQIKGPV